MDTVIIATFIAWVLIMYKRRKVRVSAKEQAYLEYLRHVNRN